MYHNTTVPRDRRWQPRGIALWILQVGFMTAVAAAVFIAVIAARWQSTESQLHLVLISASRTAVSQSFESEDVVTPGASGGAGNSGGSMGMGMMSQSGGAGIQLYGSQFIQDLQKASESALNDTGGNMVACRPIPGVSTTCQSSNGAVWWGVPVSSQLADHGVVDVGMVNTGPDHYRLAAILDPPPVLGIQVPLGSVTDLNVNLGQGDAITPAG